MRKTITEFEMEMADRIPDPGEEWNWFRVTFENARGERYSYRFPAEPCERIKIGTFTAKEMPGLIDEFSKNAYYPPIFEIYPPIRVTIEKEQ